MNVIIVGGGKIGAHLSALLLSGSHRVKVIEANREQAFRLRHDLPDHVIVLGSGTDPDVLETAGIHNADVVAAVTGEDENNLVGTSLARYEFHVPRTIARINNPRNAWMFTIDMGVDVAVNQADLMGHLIAEKMSLGDMITLLKLRKGPFSLVEEKVKPLASAVGKAVQELNLPARCLLVAVIRKGELNIPLGDFVLQQDDEVLAVVHADHAIELAGMLGECQ
jgi:trk system potassium uptake protein